MHTKEEIKAFLEDKLESTKEQIEDCNQRLQEVQNKLNNMNERKLMEEYLSAGKILFDALDT